jgi:hypothetical protein
VATNRFASNEGLASSASFGKPVLQEIFLLQPHAVHLAIIFIGNGTACLEFFFAKPANM